MVKPAEAAKPAEVKADDAAPSPSPAPAPAPAPAPEPEASPPAQLLPMEPMPVRARVETTIMPLDMHVGAPPDLPDTVEDPTSMPGPRNIPGGNPNDPAKAPGHVPKGDSRSFRRGDDFALIYRVQTYVISRFGVVGTRGQWRVVEYPTSAAAAHSYAKESSRFVSEGFSDYRG